MRNKAIIISIVILLVAIGVSFWVYQSKQPGKYDDFAKCLQEKGVKFYGAFWCSHCQDQKKMFGKSAKYLPYVECSSPDGKEQLDVCKEKNIEGYPTWVFPDGTKQEGDITLQDISQKSGCQLPSADVE